MEHDLELEALMLRDSVLNDTKEQRDGARQPEAPRPASDTLLTGAGVVAPSWYIRRRPGA